MPALVVFVTGQELTVAEAEEDVVHAVRRDHPNPVSLKAQDGRALHVNWDHVMYVRAVEAQQP
jgi:hypothetical protein